MLDRIAAGVAKQRRLVAGASHELRSPLTATRAEMDGGLLVDDLPPAARDVLHSARDEVHALARLVDDLLLLAVADAQRVSLRANPSTETPPLGVEPSADPRRGWGGR
jgi:signal transduction histidine kinase